MTTIGLVLLVLWLAVAFVALRTAGRQYFHEPRRADVTAAAVVLAVAIGIAVDPFRAHAPATGDPAASNAPVAIVSASAAGPATAPAAAPVLGVGEMFGAEFAAWQRGTIAPADYTPRGYVASVAAAKTLSRGLAALGPVRREKLVSKNAKGDVTGYEYRFDCAHGSELMGAYVDASGKIDSVGFQAIPAGG